LRDTADPERDKGHAMEFAITDPLSQVQSSDAQDNRAAKSVCELRKMREYWQNGGPTRI